MRTFTGIVATTASAVVLSTGIAAVSAETPAYTVERVTFTSGGETLVGNLYIPDGVTLDGTAEAVVVTGAWTTIKEQMSGRYATELAERGFVALSFDFRTWGESGGPTRSLEDPEMKIEDIQAAARFLASLPQVGEVNGLGVCASAGYMATAAERSDTMTSIALVAPWLHDRAIVDTVYGGPEAVAGLIEAGRRAAQAEADSGALQLITAAGPEGSDALMAFDSYYTDPDRGMVAAWENTFNVASWEGWLTFDAIRTAPAIDEPTLIVHSEAAAIPEGARAFFEDLLAPKAQLWLPDVSQFDFYDRPDAVAIAADAAADHFSRN